MKNEKNKYDLITNQFDNDRSKSLREKKYLDLFIKGMAPKAHILDIGCGMAEPIAKYIIEKGFKLTGVDSSQEMLSLARQRFPQVEWLYGDMRDIELTIQYDGIIAYDSFFHLIVEDQIKMLERFSHWLKRKGKLLITTGSQEGEVIDAPMHGVPFSYYSMASENYVKHLEMNKFTILLSEEDQPRHQIWIALKNEDKDETDSSSNQKF